MAATCVIVMLRHVHTNDFSRVVSCCFMNVDTHGRCDGEGACGVGEGSKLVFVCMRGGNRRPS